VDGRFYEIADVPPLDKKLKHDIEVVVDRIVVRPDIGTRLADSLQTALELADGLAIAEPADNAAAAAPRASLAAKPKRKTMRTKAVDPVDGQAEIAALVADSAPAAPEEAQRLVFSEKFACPVSGFTIAEI